ncbi:MAG: pyrroline-5-carboxylate reductase [Candidatus Hadarchaeota archaeon]
MKVGFIGAGKMGISLLKGMLKSRALEPSQVTVSETDPKKLNAARALGIKAAPRNEALVKISDVVFIAVKPNDVETVLKETKAVSGGKLFISIAAGVTTKFIEQRTSARVIRVMPNIAGAIGEMAAGYCPGRCARPSDNKLVEKLLGSIGVVFKVKEPLMDAVTGLSGSGPAYVAYFIKAMAEAGEELGLHGAISLALAAQTVKGTAELVGLGELPGELIQRVCTPKGTTIEGMTVLNKKKVDDAIKKAVKASAARAKELSR